MASSSSASASSSSLDLNNYCVFHEKYFGQRRRIKGGDRSRPNPNGDGRICSMCRAKHIKLRSQVTVLKTDALCKSFSIRDAPLEQLPPEVTWEIHGYALLRANDTSRKFASAVLQLPRRDAVVISGGVEQRNLAKSAPFKKQLQEEWKGIVDVIRKRLGVDPTLKLGIFKTLIAAPGTGQQCIHWDSTRGPDESTGISILLYASSGTLSTAMPRFPSSVFANLNTDAQMRASTKFLERRWFHSVPVYSGDVLIFKQSIPHYGVQNESLENRAVLFSMLLKKFRGGDDERQCFCWSYISWCFGPESKQYALALASDKNNDPLNRLSKTDAAEVRAILEKYVPEAQMHM